MSIQKGAVNMKKRYILMLALSVGAVGIFRKRKSKASNRTIDKIIQSAGIPEQLENQNEQIENTKMVAEGSQYGVQYYNELQDPEK